MGCNNRVSTMEGYAIAPQTLATGAVIEYSTFKETGGALEDIGSTGIKINKSGLYYVSFDVSATVSATAGNITVQLIKDGAPVPYVVATESSTATTDVVNLGFSTVVEVLGSCGCVVNKPTFTVENTGVGAILYNANFKVVKLA